MEKFLELSAFDYMVESLKNVKGYTVVFVTGVSDGDERYTMFHYDTQAEFNNDFEANYQAYGSIVTPKNLIEDDGYMITFKANGEIVELYEPGAYVIIDGKLQGRL